ncbi:MAG: S8/S53 family peptidase [Deltaproteobacteria bacterium]|nr:S8/S53 family peptidase [Deltaproteobacteria bacterium]
MVSTLPGLEGFCEYRPTPEAPCPLPRENLARVDPIVGRVLTQSGAGSTLVGPQTGLAGRLAPALSLLFEHHANVPVGPALASTTPPVRLAVVDTMPAGATAPNSVHGPTVGAIASRMACGRSGCAVEVVHHLGLPRVQGGQEDPIHGGYYGTLWDLARGIAEAVDAASSSSQRLVINLSLGWARDPDSALRLVASTQSTPTHGTQDLETGEQAVYAALVAARQQGALVLAASGNETAPGASGEGPLLPAAWAELPVPVGVAGPLVVPVGGVDSHDQRLENARPGSTPVLVAPGSGAAVPGSAVLTGTSLSTVIASSAAALVWSIQPNLTAEEVLAVVMGSADRLPLQAEFCTTDDCSARRVSVCGAQLAACEGNMACMIDTCDSPYPRPVSRIPEVFLGGAAGMTPEWLTHGPEIPTSCGRTFELTSSSTTGQGAEAHCPSNLTWAVRQLDTGPQPNKGSCPACGSGGGGSTSFAMLSSSEPPPPPPPFWVILELAATLPGGQIHHPYIRFLG